MKKSWLPLAVLALMASCSSDEVNTPVDLTDTPITVNASVNPSASLKLRTVDNSNTSLPAQFYLNITNADKAKYSYEAVMKPVTEGETTTWKSYDASGNDLLMLWADSKTDVDVKASTFGISDNGIAELTANTDQTVAANMKESDHLMCDIAKQAPNKDGIEIAFNHIMAKLKIVITLGNEYDSKTTPIEAVTIRGTKVKGNFDRAKFSEGTAWSFADDAKAEEVKAYDCDKFVAYDADKKEYATAQYEAILVPQTLTKTDFSVTITINKKDYEWKYDDADKAMESGICYELKLKAGKDKVETISLTPMNWAETSSTLTTD